jgi:hypothetical protein
VQPEGLCKLKKCIHLIGSLSSGLPACNIAPTTTTLPSAPNDYALQELSLKGHCWPANRSPSCVTTDRLPVFLGPGTHSGPITALLLLSVSCEFVDVGRPL